MGPLLAARHAAGARLYAVIQLMVLTGPAYVMTPQLGFTSLDQQGKILLCGIESVLNGIWGRGIDVGRDLCRINAGRARDTGHRGGAGGAYTSLSVNVLVSLGDSRATHTNQSTLHSVFPPLIVPAQASRSAL